MPDQSPQQLSPSDFAAKVKAKYPAYASLPDDQLVEKITAKFPQYKSQINFGVTGTKIEDQSSIRQGDKGPFFDPKKIVAGPQGGIGGSPIGNPFDFSKIE